VSGNRFFSYLSQPKLTHGEWVLGKIPYYNLQTHPAYGTPLFLREGTGVSSKKKPPLS
jgi:hypothetical protein